MMRTARQIPVTKPWRTPFVVLCLLLMLTVSGCLRAPASERRIADLLINEDTSWSGTVIISGTVTVSRDARLTVMPGTHVLFVRSDADRDGLGDAGIVVKGRLEARGNEGAPVVFASAEAQPEPGDWLEIRSDFARELTFDWCEIRDSAYTIHAHFTQGHLKNSHIHHNIDGSRLGRSKFQVRHNLIEANKGKGINFRDSRVTLADNIIRNNGTGIFLFEKPGQSVIRSNNVYANDMNLRLGDFFTENIALENNWWGSDNPDRIAASVYDQKQDAEIGQVALSPAKAWHPEAGIQRTAGLKTAWSLETGGYVDASPIVQNERVFAASWDGQVYALDTDGNTIWTTSVDDIVDADMALDARNIYVQDWSRSVSRIDLENGKRETLMRYQESPADDHRQAGLLREGPWLYVAGWNGTLYGVHLANPELNWTQAVGMPLRARPVIYNGRLYVASAKGVLTALEQDGTRIWAREFPQPLLSAPVVTQTRIFLVDKAGTLYALDQAGKLQWSSDLGEPCFYGQPVLDRDELYLATAGGGLWKFDAFTGAPVWRTELAGPSYATPLLLDGLLAIGDNSGTLAIYDRDSGRRISQLEHAGEIQSTPVAQSSRLFYGSRDRHIRAVDLVRPGEIKESKEE